MPLDTLHHKHSDTGYDRAELITLWLKYHGYLPPKGLSRKTLELAVTWHQQATQTGGLNRDSQRYLLKLAKNGKGDRLPPQALVKPGARLVREWRGEPHVVDVLETGFLYKEDVYASLSEIARLITGARWSGPRFFGLTKANRKEGST